MTAKILTVFNQKGGCGKTTVTMQIAGTAGLRGLRVLIVDLDRQGTAMQWTAQADEAFPASVINLAHLEGKAHREIKNHIEAYDLILVDCPPSITSLAPTSAMLVSDAAIIPIQFSPGDIWAADSAIQLAQQASASNPDLRVRLVANMVMGRTQLEKALREHTEESSEFPLLKTSLAYRNAYRESTLLGATVHALKRQKAACAEIDALTDEVFDLLDIKK